MSSSLSPRADVESQLPLTPLSFHILLVLLDGDQHGYGIMKAIEQRTDGKMAPATGALYLAAQRLLDAGLIAEVTNQPGSDAGDRRRKYYAITEFGKQVAAAEAERLVNLVGIAFEKRLVNGRFVLSDRSRRDA